MRSTSTTLFLGFSVALTACGADEHGAHSDAGYNCAVEDRDDEFAAGMQKTGAAGIRVGIASAVPAPPQRGDNTWNVTIADTNGAPVIGATIAIKPFMPDHRHGTSIPATITPGAAAGSYVIAPVNLWMPGLWETTIDVTTGSGRDSVVFRFCIAS